ncbi:MAG: hypothetical protein RRB24_09700 [Armatimonadota bacterium]|nr:hypothetical protein [Armatimonadota bacterium]MDT7973087.1 hypothetical protein [Armatimonadota bacterium]
MNCSIALRPFRPENCPTPILTQRFEPSHKASVSETIFAVVEGRIPDAPKPVRQGTARPTFVV